MKIIHVAGTKGNGSTCTFSESILRHCSFRTGLFTSPHLIDVRERFRLDGYRVDISEEKFLEYFWWPFNRLKEKASDDIPMPTYIRFLALLAFKIFSREKVQAPVVCGISSLGYDHMEILGYTLGAIAGEKARIFKVPLQTVPPVNTNLLNGLKLGLEGEHQYVNAGLAVALCSTWLQRIGHLGITHPENTTSLPEQFIKGLTTTVSLQGRAQIVPDDYTNNDSPGDLTFYLDGSYSPESMEICARLFLQSHADVKAKKNSQLCSSLWSLPL